jgi:hypothetical protein
MPSIDFAGPPDEMTCFVYGAEVRLNCTPVNKGPTIGIIEVIYGAAGFKRLESFFLDFKSRSGSNTIWPKAHIWKDGDDYNVAVRFELRAPRRATCIDVAGHKPMFPFRKIVVAAGANIDTLSCVDFLQQQYEHKYFAIGVCRMLGEHTSLIFSHIFSDKLAVLYRMKPQGYDERWKLSNHRSF